LEKGYNGWFMVTSRDTDVSRDTPFFGMFMVDGGAVRGVSGTLTFSSMGGFVHQYRTVGDFECSWAWCESAVPAYCSG
jgi:hypothetical protein